MVAWGGALADLDGCAFDTNHGGFGGGAVAAYDANTIADISGGSINLCTAGTTGTGGGGAVYSAPGPAHISLTDTPITSCSAPFGGAAFASQGTLTLDGCAVTGNTGTTSGGAVYALTSLGEGERTYHFEGAVTSNTGTGNCPQFSGVQIGDPFTVTFTVDTTVPPDIVNPESAIYGDQSFISVSASIDGVAQGPFDDAILAASVFDDLFGFDQFNPSLPLVGGETIQAFFDDFSATALSSTAWPTGPELNLANWSAPFLTFGEPGGGCLVADITSVSVVGVPQIQVRDCDFQGNVSAGDGGAIVAIDSAADISGSRFFDNTADGVGDASSPFGGGAIMAQDFTNLSISNSTFASNQTTGTGPHDGGAILLIDGSTADLDNTILWGNTSAAVISYHFEGTVTNNNGGCPQLADVQVGDPFIVTVTVDTTVPPTSSSSNTATYGAASFISVSASIDGVAQGPFDDAGLEAQVTNDIGLGEDFFFFLLPLAGGGSIALAFEDFGSSFDPLSGTAWPTGPELNPANWQSTGWGVYGTGGLCLQANNPTSVNVNVELSTAGDQILLDTSPFSVNPNTAMVDFSLVEGWTGTIPGVSTSGDDPLFTNIGTGDLTIGPGSPAIDAGDNDAAVGSLDLAGNPRFHDDTGTPDTGNGVAPIVDKGAYEFQETTTCAEDTNGDGIINVTDLLALLAAWGPCDAPCPPTCAADTNNDCVVSVTDLLALLAAWGSCN